MPYGNLHMTHHGCRPRISILCWSRINSSLQVKYLAVYLFEVSIWWPILGPEKTPEGSEAGEKTGAVFTIKPIVVYSFLPTPEFDGTSFSWIWAFALLALEALQALFGIYFKVSSFSSRPCSVYKYSFGTLVWSWDQTVSTEAGWKCLRPNSFRRSCFKWNHAVCSGFSLFLWKGYSLEMGWKSLWLSSSGTKQFPLSWLGLACQLFELSCLCCKSFELFENCSLL